MLDYILTTRDLAIFIPIFGRAIVVVRPGFLTGSGRAKVRGKTICVDGDEKKVSVPVCPYTKLPLNLVPGVGTLSIQSLAANQKAKRVKSGGKAVLLKGSTFNTKFQVTFPALRPPPALPLPDTTRRYSGKGRFITFNMRAKGN